MIKDRLKPQPSPDSLSDLSGIHASCVDSMSHFDNGNSTKDTTTDLDTTPPHITATRATAGKQQENDNNRNNSSHNNKDDNRRNTNSKNYWRLQQ